MTFFIIGMLATFAVWAAWAMWGERGIHESALIVRNERGGWSVHTATSEPYGNFATPTDAARAAVRAGYAPILDEEGE
jgi:hypothetical protein